MAEVEQEKSFVVYYWISLRSYCCCCGLCLWLVTPTEGSQVVLFVCPDLPMFPRGWYLGVGYPPYLKCVSTNVCVILRNEHV